MRSPRTAPLRRPAFHAVLLATGLAAAALDAMPAAAATFSDPSVFVQAGQGDEAVRSATVGAMFEVRPDRVAADSPWSFVVEAAVGEWFVHEPRDGARLRFYQFGLTPSVRYRIGGVFVEAGIGAALITPHFQDGDRRFSTGFNFGDHLGIGTRFGANDANELMLRVEHFSNGGIRNPNPGQNFVELRYGRRF